MASVVCHVSTVHEQNDTRIFLKECKSLAAHGYDVRFVVPGESAIVDDVKVIGIPRAKNRVERFVKLRKTAFQIAKAQNATIYQLHDPELLTIAIGLKRNGSHVVFDSHEITAEQIREKPYLPKPLAEVISRVYKAYESYVCRRIDAVIVPASSHGVNPFEGRSRKSVYIDNFPITKGLPEEHSKIDRSRSNSICYAGSLTHARGITHLIKAAYMAGVTLILCGNIHPDYLEELRRLDEWKCVDFRGMLDKKGVQEVYDACFCGTAALLNRGQYWTGGNLSTKAYEYMLNGMPFICSPTPYAKEFAQEHPCCLLVDPEDVTAYASAIVFLRDNKEDAAEMGRVGFEAVRASCCWESEEKKLVALYEELIG